MVQQRNSAKSCIPEWLLIPDAGERGQLPAHPTTAPPAATTSSPDPAPLAHPRDCQRDVPHLPTVRADRAGSPHRCVRSKAVTTYRDRSSPSRAPPSPSPSTHPPGRCAQTTPTGSVIVARRLRYTPSPSGRPSRPTMRQVTSLPGILPAHARKQAGHKRQPMKPAAIGAFRGGRGRQVNDRDAEQIPPFPARIRNGTPGFPRQSGTNRVGRRS